MTLQFLCFHVWFYDNLAFDFRCVRRLDKKLHAQAHSRFSQVRENLLLGNLLNTFCLNCHCLCRDFSFERAADTVANDVTDAAV